METSEYFKFESPKGEFSIHQEENIIVFKSRLIKGYVSTINYPKDWALIRVMQHIIDLEQNHTTI